MDFETDNTMTFGGMEFDFKPSEFSNIELDFELEFETRYIKPPKTKEIAEHNLKYELAYKLAEDIKIDIDNRYFAIITGSFIFGDFIEALIKEKEYLVKKMTISTLSMTEANVDSLANLLNNEWVDELDLIISGFHYSHKRWTIVKYTYDELDKDNKFQLAVADCHTKICIFETHCGKKIVIHGSANLCSSGCIEQIVIKENEQLYDFNYSFHQSIINKFKTINKPVRGKNLVAAIKNS